LLCSLGGRGGFQTRFQTRPGCYLRVIGWKPQTVCVTPSRGVDMSKIAHAATPPGYTSTRQFSRAVPKQGARLIDRLADQAEFLPHADVGDIAEPDALQSLTESIGFALNSGLS